MIDLLGWIWTLCSFIFYFIKTTIFSIFLLVVALGLYYFFFVRPQRKEQQIERMKMEKKLFRFHSLSFEVLSNAFINVTMRLSELEKQSIDLVILNGLQYRIESIDVQEEEVKISFEHSNILLTIQHEYLEHQLSSSNKVRFFHQYTFTWSSSDYRSRFHDKITLKDTGYWYGGATKRTVYWPINEFVTHPEAMVPNDAYKNMFGNVCERYWLSSVGLAIFIDPLVPLFVSMNRITLDLISQYRRPYQQSSPISHRFQYKLIQNVNMTDLHLFMIDRYLGKPRDMPDQRMIVEPIWSTWAQFKQQINTEKILNYANEIVRHDFPRSQICIDDNWTPHYGVYQFDSKKFPSPKTMIDRLKELNFRVTLWIHPFVSCRSWQFFDYWRQGYLIRLRLIPSLIDFLMERSRIFRLIVNDVLNKPDYRSLIEQIEYYYHRIPFYLPGIALWWNGLAGVIDLTNTRARQAYQLSLQRLQTQYSVDSFKFDAGEVNWLPIFGSFSDPSCQTLANEFNSHITSPALFPYLYAHVSYNIDPDRRLQEVRVGYRTQALPMFVRIIDKDSNWSYNNGLRSLLPSVFNLSLLGYPFILPDMVGGNGYGLTITQTRLPQRELYIRWLQLNVLLPAIQISFPPWLYADEQVIRIAKKCFDIRQRYRSVLLSTAEEAVRFGLPMIRPLWFRDPYNLHAHLCDSEYLLGDDLLIAPVLDENVQQIKIHFPQGQWKCIETNRVYNGNQTINYPVTLDDIPIFERCDISDLTSE